MLAVELKFLSTTKCKVSQQSNKVCGSHDSEHKSPAWSRLQNVAS